MWKVAPEKVVKLMVRQMHGHFGNEPDRFARKAAKIPAFLFRGDMVPMLIGEHRAVRVNSPLQLLLLRTCKRPALKCDDYSISFATMFVEALSASETVQLRSISDDRTLFRRRE
jgi:hypothetical protein